MSLFLILLAKHKADHPDSYRIRPGHVINVFFALWLLAYVPVRLNCDWMTRAAGREIYFLPGSFLPNTDRILYVIYYPFFMIESACSTNTFVNPFTGYDLYP